VIWPDFNSYVKFCWHNAELMMLSELKQFLDKTVSLRMTNGEIAKVKVRFVDDEYDDLIVDVLETSAPERYRDGLAAAYTFAASDIESAEAAK
jgi:small nuclear ribonucleoprotein (snRNP)-like protein